MIAQKLFPGLRRRLSPPHHVLGYRRLRDVNTEFQQFSVDTRSTPELVCHTHPSNQLSVSWGTEGRPPRIPLFQVQYNRNPFRCQAITVSGLTITKAERHPDHSRDSQTQKARSTSSSRSRRLWFDAGVRGADDARLRLLLPAPPSAGGCFARTRAGTKNIAIIGFSV